MCAEDHDKLEHADYDDIGDGLGSSITRRHFGGLLVGAASLATLGPLVRGAAAARAAPVTSADGLTAFANAMHIHTSFSEGKGSFQAQLSEAVRNHVQVLWKTDHDWRELAHGSPTRISFTSLTDEQIAGSPLVWRAQVDGVLAESAGGIVTAPVSPADPNPTPGALWVRARSGSSTPASLRYYADFEKARLSQRTNIGGQLLQLDVYPTQAHGANSYLEVLVTLSYHPAVGTRPAGQYQLSYRLATTMRALQASELLGVVPKLVVANRWQQVTLDLAADVQHLWPDLVAADNALYDIWLGVTSQQGELAEGYFDNLRFVRGNVTAAGILAAENTLKSAYRSLYPSVSLPRGREISYYDHHLNAFGASVIPDYANMPTVWPTGSGWEFSTHVTQQIHAAGGLVSFNHPFGTSEAAPADPASQAAALAQVFHNLYVNSVCGVDVLEVGYQQRGGIRINKKAVTVDINTHQELWDMFSRNGFYLTANGVSDNHNGVAGEWAKQRDRFITYIWAKTINEADLTAALASGRVYVGELTTFSGTLDLLVDDVVPMGAVSVRPGITTRRLTIIAANLPAGSSVQVLQGPVDYPGLSTADSAKTTIATLPAGAFATGRTTITLDTHRSSYVRLAVRTSAGRTVAFSNPIWLLAEPSRRPVPPSRTAVDSLL